MKILFLILISIFIVSFSGCGGASKFYHLYPTIPAKEGSHTLSKRVIGIAEIKLADYIDKPQIITQKNQNAVDIHEKENWAGDFAKNIQIVIAQDLNHLTKRYTFISLPSEEVINDKYRLFITIDRFDTTADDIVKLQGRWTLNSIDNNKIIKIKSFNYSLCLVENSKDKVENISYTKSLLLERLSKDIAFAIKAI